MSRIPSHWKLCKLGDVIRLKNGYAFKSVDYAEEGIPLVRISDINDNKVTTETSVRIPKDKTNNDFLIKPGDLLIAMSGATTGKTGVYNEQEPVLQNQRVGNFKIIDNTILDEKYRNYYVASLRKDIEKAAYGGAQPNISSKGIEAFDIPIAPIKEQKHIVAEIEKQFSRLDEAVANLMRVKANLKRYKAAVLKAAVEGKLTEEWRKANPDVESAGKLSERILTERRKKWEENELAKMKAKDKEPKDNKWKKKYKELPQFVSDNLSELPDSWQWVTWGSVLSYENGAFKRGPFGSALKKSIFVEAGYKVYEQYCPINDDPYFARYFITEEKFREMEGFAVKAKDFLISCSGVTLGRITQVPDDYEEGIINQALLRVRLNNDAIDDSYFIRLFRSPFFQQQIFDNAQGAAIPNVKGVKELKAIPVPLPSLQEQYVVAQIIDERMSVVSEIEKEIETNLKRAERLRQSILSKAFSGNLITAQENIDSESNLKKLVG